MIESLRPVEGSFREAGSRVFVHGGRILRFLDTESFAQYKALSSTLFFRDAMQGGAVIKTWAPHDAEQLVESTRGEWGGVLEHTRIPVVTYPYEWAFPMLREAALLQLSLLLGALGEGFMGEDATPYNMQWQGTQPIFIDVTSFKPHTEGDTWQGYRQFCQLYLYPLLFEAYRGIPFQMLLRGSLEGVEPARMARFFGWRDVLRRGIMTHVLMHASLSRAYGSRSGDVRSNIQQSGFSVEAIRHNMKGLQRLVYSLGGNDAGDSVWSGYAEDESYDENGFDLKKRIVAEWLAAREWDVVWDVGANRGIFSRMAADNAKTVLALDGDEAVVGALFAALKKEGAKNIIPLVYRFNDPSPALGWRGLERPTLEQRAKPSLVMMLAVIHHLSITANIPVAAILDYLRELGGDVIIEFVDRDDAKAKGLLQNKRKEHADYTRENFERQLAARFSIAKVEPLSGGTRILYFASPLV